VENNWLRRRVLEKKNPGRQQPCWGSLFCTNLTQPTGNLDSKTSDEVIALLKMTAKKYGQTIVMITHDDEIAQVADRILVIEDGQVVDFR
jgi:predicted ABC-type transport system involved in lysophospholipase L1 biosynthesis ATPase subunit